MWVFLDRITFGLIFRHLLDHLPVFLNLCINYSVWQHTQWHLTHFFLLSFEFSFNFVYGLRKHTREQTHFHLLDDRNWENMVNQNRLKHVWPFPPPSNTAWWVLWDCLSVLKDTHTHTLQSVRHLNPQAHEQLGRTEKTENKRMKRWYDNDMNLDEEWKRKRNGINALARWGVGGRPYHEW